jgi:hypothetical protein
MHYEHVRDIPVEHDRLEVVDGVKRKFFVEVDVRRERAGRCNDERVAVGGRLGDELHADVEVCTGAIVDDDVLSIALAHGFCEQPRNGIDRAARWRRHHQPYGSRRIGVGCLDRYGGGAAQHQAHDGCDEAVHGGNVSGKERDCPSARRDGSTDAGAR